MTPKDFEPKPSLETKFSELLDVCEEIRTFALKRIYPRTIFQLSDEEQQAHIDFLNDYMSFEFGRKPDLKGATLSVDGHGLMLLANSEGEVIGGETISNGDIVTSHLDDIWFLPVPTLECIQLGDSEQIPSIDQTLSPLLMLRGVTYYTGALDNGEFEIVHDLGDTFEIGLALAHALRPTVRE